MNLGRTCSRDLTWDSREELKGDANSRSDLSSNAHGGDGVDHGQEAIQRHEDQRVDTGVHGDDDEILDDLAPDVTERPERQNIIGAGERNTEDDEEQVGQR